MTNISLVLESGPISVDPESCNSTNPALEISTINMPNLEESEESSPLMYLLPQYHLLSSDNCSRSSDDINANSALKNLCLKNLGRMIIGYLKINSITKNLRH